MFNKVQTQQTKCNDLEWELKQLTIVETGWSEELLKSSEKQTIGAAGDVTNCICINLKNDLG